MTVATMRKFEKSINGKEVTLDLDGTPREIDETLCRLWRMKSELNYSKDVKRRNLWNKYTETKYGKYGSRSVQVKKSAKIGPWKVDLDEIPQEAIVDRFSDLLKLTDESDRTALEGIEELSRFAEECDDLIFSIDSEYQVRRWSRFFLVTSSSGHIHSSMCCSTCNKGRKATTFALLPELSGKDEKAAVDKLGPALCSVCFPSAPVEFVENAKVDKKLAEILRTKGSEAFDEALKAANERAAKRAKNSCPMAGKKAPRSERKMWSRSVENAWCPECERWTRVTKNGVFAKHQKAKR